MAFLSWIENSAFPTWVRSTPSIWGYSMIVFLHTIGLVMVVGLSLVIDLRLLGLLRRMPVAPLGRFLPLVWIGFWINAASGLVLFAQDATATAVNPLFGVKMMLIALAALDTLAIQRLVFMRPHADRPISWVARLLAIFSIVLWFAATTAGQLMVYTRT